MTIRHTLSALLCSLVLATSGTAQAQTLASGVIGGAAQKANWPQPVDYRPYYHCHGPKRCHGKGNYYKYTPSESSEPYGCRLGRGCGYNTGWNSPSSRFDYTGRRYGHRHHHRRHRH